MIVPELCTLFRMSVLAASRVGTSGKVIAFEPSSDNCALLRTSIRVNDFANVVLYQYAVADRDRIVGYGMDDSNGRISLGSPTDSPYQVRSVRLDTLLGNEARIDIIKLDIEGAEEIALEGMEQLIQNHRPVIISEFSPRGLAVVSGTAPNIFLHHLRDLGYDLYVIHPGSGHSSSPQSDKQILGHFAQFGDLNHLDLLACPTPEISSEIR